MMNEQTPQQAAIKCTAGQGIGDCDQGIELEKQADRVAEVDVVAAAAQAPREVLP